MPGMTLIPPGAPASRMLQPCKMTATDQSSVSDLRMRAAEKGNTQGERPAPFTPWHCMQATS